MKKLLVNLIACLLLPSAAMAGGLSFINISQDDFDSIIQDLGGLYAHTSVSPASSLGKVFGFELGVIAGAAQVPGVEDLVKEADPTADASVLPHAGLLAAVSFPFGIKAEVGMLPEQDLGDVEFKYTSFALQWTMTDVLFALPVDLAIKAHQASTTLGYVQDVSGTPANIEVDNAITGFMAMVSKKLSVFEPYAGFGSVSADGKMSISGSNEFFDFTNNQYAKSKTSGTQFVAGFNLNLAIFKFGLETGKVFDATKASLKLSLFF